MKIGMIGLGKMGGNLARNLRDQGFDVVVYNHTPEKVKAMVEEGLVGAFTLDDLTQKIGDQGVYWVMVPSGPATQDVFDQLIALAPKGSLMIDGGNSNYHDTMARAKTLISLGFRFMDIGTSGGQAGARNGACMMVGGNKEDYTTLAPILEAICVPGGVNYMGQHGMGHYVKMIHNGIEYGMMQAIAEGFDLLQASEYDLNLVDIAGVWQNGSIIASYLVDKTSDALKKNPSLEGIKDQVDSSGEGLWTVEEALRLKVPAYVITSSLFKRYESKQDNRYTNKLLAAMRNEFGGHALHKVTD